MLRTLNVAIHITLCIIGLIVIGSIMSGIIYALIYYSDKFSNL